MANKIYNDEGVSFSLNNDLCDCENSIVWDPHNKHIISGDLRITEKINLQSF